MWTKIVSYASQTNQLKPGWTLNSTMSTEENKIFTPDKSDTMLEIFEFCKLRGWKCNCKKGQQMQRIKTEVGKGWFSLTEFLSSLQTNSYVSHFDPQKRKPGFQLKL